MPLRDALSEISELLSQQRRWLVTGAAGFIGSHLVEALLLHGQQVIGLDNFSTGRPENLRQVQQRVGVAFDAFQMIEGDIRDAQACHEAAAGANYILHQAAAASVPLSMERPVYFHEVNVTGTLNVLEAARSEGIERVVYASSSAVYGDCDDQPQIEGRIGRSLSPYGASKRIDEIYGELYSSAFGLVTVGLRYFNVYGPRQDPEGAYAAVIPRWIAAMVADLPVTIYGDQPISRDFCFVADVVQANLRAALVDGVPGGEVLNVASGEEVSLSQLFEALREGLNGAGQAYSRRPVVGPPRPGDILRSSADIAKARTLIGFDPLHDLERGLRPTIEFYRGLGD